MRNVRGGHGGKPRERIDALHVIQRANRGSGRGESSSSSRSLFACRHVVDRDNKLQEALSLR